MKMRVNITKHIEIKGGVPEPGSVQQAHLGTAADRQSWLLPGPHLLCEPD